MTSRQAGHLDEREVWPEERWRALQRRRLRRVLDVAWRHLPFHRRRLEAAGLTPGSVRSLDDLRRLPPFRKADVLQAMGASGSHEVGLTPPEEGRPTALSLTSGTLGTSFLTLPDTWLAAQGDSLLRAYWWAGLRPGMSLLVAAPGWHALSTVESYVVQRLHGRAVVPWGTFLPRFAPRYLSTLRDQRPDVVSLFLPMLFALLAECRRLGLAPVEAFRGVRSVIVMGAPLTPRFREALVADLGVGDIYELAGNPEGLRAMECEAHAGHHLFVDLCLAEVIDPHSGEALPPGRRGSVVVTFLLPHGTLYLRYDTEDVGELLPGACACGRTWPRLELYDRRANAFLAGGSEWLPYDVRLCFDEVDGLRGVPFAVIRHPGGSAQVQVVVQAPPGVAREALAQRAAQQVAARLGLPLAVQWAEALPERWKGTPVIDAAEWAARRG